MTRIATPQLTHMALYARDCRRLATFYAEVVGLVVSDEGYSERARADFVFMTADPEKHHQFVVVSGRGPDAPTTVNQVSFIVDSLAAVRAVHDRARDAGAKGIRPVSHGNALSVYFEDPEGNTVEIYCDTPWYVPQPFGVPIDLSETDHAIMARTEALCRATPGFKTRAAWIEELSGRIKARLAAR